MIRLVAGSIEEVTERGGERIMTSEQFVVLVKLMRGQLDSAANKAARRVLVDGISQADAMRETGASRSTVSLTVQRYLEAYNLIRAVY